MFNKINIQNGSRRYSSGSIEVNELKLKRTVYAKEWPENVREGLNVGSFMAIQLNERPIDYKDNEKVVMTDAWWSYVLKINNYDQKKINQLILENQKGVYSLNQYGQVVFHYPICFGGGNIVEVLDDTSYPNFTKIKIFSINDTPPVFGIPLENNPRIHIEWCVGGADNGGIMDGQYAILGGIYVPIINQLGYAWIESALLKEI